MKIIVTGSLGNISKPLTKQLLEKGHSVTVISSQLTRQKEIEALGATSAIGSLEDADFLVKTFKGADAIYCMVPPNFGEANQVAYYSRIGHSYASAIEQTGVKRVVYLSSYGAHLDKGTGFILGAHHVERILNNLSGVAITHLRPGYFYYNLLSFVDMIKTAGFIGANFGGDDQLVLVHPSDIADAAAEELTTATVENNIRYIASDDRTASKVAAILGNAIGKADLKWILFTNEQSKEGMEKRGMPSHVVSNFVDLGASTHSGVMREDYDLHKPATMGKIKLEDFASEFAAAFKK